LKDELNDKRFFCDGFAPFKKGVNKQTLFMGQEKLTRLVMSSMSELKELTLLLKREDKGCEAKCRDLGHGY